MGKCGRVMMSSSEISRYEKNSQMRLRETRDIPVIMLTAVQDTAAIYKAKDAGVTDYLIKPLHFDELLVLIKRYL
jgi:DNA-binding response OmpR family regulator